MWAIVCDIHEEALIASEVPAADSPERMQPSLDAQSVRQAFNDSPTLRRGVSIATRPRWA